MHLVSLVQMYSERPIRLVENRPVLNLEPSVPTRCKHTLYSRVGRIRIREYDYEFDRIRIYEFPEIRKYEYEFIHIRIREYSQIHEYEYGVFVSRDTNMDVFVSQDTNTGVFVSQDTNTSVFVSSFANTPVFVKILAEMSVFVDCWTAESMLKPRRDTTSWVRKWSSMLKMPEIQGAARYVLYPFSNAHKIGTRGGIGILFAVKILF